MDPEHLGQSRIVLDEMPPVTEESNLLGVKKPSYNEGQVHINYFACKCPDPKVGNYGILLVETHLEHT